MKRVCYVLIHPDGPAIATVSASCQQHESDETNLKLFEPDAIRGQLQVNVKRYMDDGYQLSNWHIVESTDDTLCSRRDWHEGGILAKRCGRCRAHVSPGNWVRSPSGFLLCGKCAAQFP